MSQLGATDEGDRPFAVSTLAAAGVGLLVLVLAAIWWLASAESEPLPPKHFNDTTLKKLSNLYTSYSTKNGNLGPPDEATFKQYIRDADPYLAKAIDFNPSDPDRLFVSTRDGKPFRVRYRVRLGNPRSPAPIIHEAAGVDGRHEVGFAYGRVEEVDEARLRQLFP